MTPQEIMERLQAPFSADEIEWRVGSTNADKTQGLALAYVTNRAIQNRLDEVFGIFGWQNEFREWKGTAQICGISIKHDGEWITKWDGADDSNMEATKGGLSDAQKRAGCQLGIGRYLHKLEGIWCAIEPCGKSYRLKTIPKLPDWALPESERGKNKAAESATNVQNISKVQTPVDKPQAALPASQALHQLIKEAAVDGLTGAMARKLILSVIPEAKFKDNKLVEDGFGDFEYACLCEQFRPDVWKTKLTEMESKKQGSEFEQLGISLGDVK